MNILESIILGIIQGITEFLPISSSGHLILGRSFLGGVETAQSLAFDVLLHLLTALVIVVYFRKDIIDIIKKGWSIWKIILVGIIPAGFVGFFFGDYISYVFRNNITVIIMLILGSFLMILAEYIGKKINNKDSFPNIKQSILIGLFQVFALIPGTSRSGSTIAGGLISGLDRSSAAKFSFIMGLPLILAAGFSKAIGIDSNSLNLFSIEFMVGGIAAVVSGFFAIHFLMKVVQKKTLWPFIYYRFVLAIILIFFLI